MRGRGSSEGGIYIYTCGTGKGSIKRILNIGKGRWECIYVCILVKCNTARISG